MDDMDPQELENDENGFSYKAMLKRDRRRWSIADRDGDDSLTKVEFSDFLHPEESDHMRDIVVVGLMISPIFQLRVHLTPISAFRITCSFVLRSFHPSEYLAGRNDRRRGQGQRRPGVR